MNPVHFSSKQTVVETPPEIFEPLDEEFDFTTDVCALPENAKCKHYFTPEQDGLSQRWEGMCWCNPPYGREIPKWVCKAYQSAQAGHCTTVMLLPARTDTQWFHNYIYNKAEIRFLKGRITFVGQPTSAPFPSMIVVFRKKVIPHD